MKRLVALALVLVVAGCAREQEAGVPEACTDTRALVSALSAAPSPVRADGVRISECLVKDSPAGDVQVVGFSLVETAARLGREGNAVALGYLVGALRWGAERSQGIHLELVRRVEQEAAAFRGSPAFDRGLRAGRSSG